MTFAEMFLMAMAAKGGGGSGGTISVPSHYIFPSNTDRDSYFDLHKDELVEQVYIISGNELQQYRGGSWISMSIAIKGEKGEKGDTVVGPAGQDGSDGAAATITIGSVVSGTPVSVTNSGTNTNAIFNFVLPKGDKGDAGGLTSVAVDGVTIYGNGVDTPLRSPRQGIKLAGPYATVGDIPTPYEEDLIYLVGDVNDDNPYTQYVLGQNGELHNLGGTSVDLSNYYTKAEDDDRYQITVNAIANERNARIAADEQVLADSKTYTDTEIAKLPNETRVANLETTVVNHENRIIQLENKISNLETEIISLKATPVIRKPEVKPYEGSNDFAILFTPSFFLEIWVLNGTESKYQLQESDYSWTNNVVTINPSNFTWVDGMTVKFIYAAAAV